MSSELAIKILKQATLDTTTGACEKCPRKDKNKTCIGCLDDAKEKVLDILKQKENIIKEVREYITSYESIDTIQGLEDIENNKNFDEKTMIEMVRRYMIVHDKVLEILDKENI